MELKSGFFNSVVSDRVYDAVDFTNYLKGIITNGCMNLETVPDQENTGFMATESQAGIQGYSPSVVIGSGKAYLNGMWAMNTSGQTYTLTQTQAHQLAPGMKHLIYFCFDTNVEGATARSVTINHVTGLDPQLPDSDLPANAGKFYMKIAIVRNRADLSQPVGGINGDIDDWRTYAGVSGVGVGSTASLADGVLTLPKFALSVVDGGKFLVPLDDGLVKSVMIGDQEVGLAKFSDPTVLSDVYFTDSDQSVQFKSDRELGVVGSTTKRLAYTAIANSRLKVDATVIVDAATASAKCTVYLRLKYRVKTGTTWSSTWVELGTPPSCWVAQTIQASTRWTTIPLNGVLDMAVGKSYEIAVFGESPEEYIAVRTFRITAAVGPRPLPIVVA